MAIGANVAEGLLFLTKRAVAVCVQYIIDNVRNICEAHKNWFLETLQSVKTTWQKYE